MTRAVACIAVLVLAAASSAAVAGTVYVPADRPTIQAGIDAAQSGDTVLVAAGTYRETVLVASRTDLTLRAAAGVTVLPGKTVAPAFRLQGCTRVVLDGFAVTNARAEGVFAENCSFVTVSHCSVTRSRFEGIRVDASADCTVADCTVTRTGRRAAGISLSLGGGHASDRGTVQRCNVVRSGGEGIDVHGDSVVVEDCTVANSKDDGIELDRDLPVTTNGIVRRCFVTGAGSVGIICTGTGNLVEGNTVTRAGFHGISVFAATGGTTSGNTVRGNAVNGTVRHDGIEVIADANAIEDNDVTRTRQDGVYVDGAGNTAARNSVTLAGLYGFELAPTASGTALTDNSATASRRADLFDRGTGTTLTANTFPNVRK